MKLYFKNYKGKEKLIATPQDYDDLWHEIHKYLDKMNFKSYYTRIINRNEEFKIDYGSHTEFFVVKEVSNPEDVVGSTMREREG